METIIYERAKKTFAIAAETAATLIALDLLILFASLAQITAEGQSGYWSPFWKTQAEIVLSIIL